MDKPTLIVLAGLPATGKSSIARELTRELGAFWLRIDSIEQALKESGALKGSVDGAGYEVAHRLAEDNLNLRRCVIADCVNPWMLTRDAWRQVGLSAGANVVEVEIICSNQEEHRRRVETRRIDVAGLSPPQWQEIMDCDYHAWERDRLIIDTAKQNLADCVASIRAAQPTKST